ncbi:MAG TPA: SRPBCC domain-containing protein [Thermoplasmata archaeon]|nr:SRPBCC domain-containing protein [Thermoplasmata archaeon]
MKEIRTEIDIEASAVRVWDFLTDFPAFPEWNPFIRRISGEAKVGTKLEVLMQSSGTRGMSFRPTVMKVERDRELRWLGRLGVPGLFDGEHIFEIEDLGPKRVHFVQRERFRGILVPLLARSLERDAKRGFEEMNQALRTRAEAISPP